MTSVSEDLAALRVRLGAADDTDRRAALQQLHDLDLTDPSRLAAVLDTVEELPSAWNKEINRRIAKALIDERHRPEILAVLVDKLGVSGPMTRLYCADGYNPPVSDEEIVGPLELLYHHREAGPIDKAKDDSRGQLRDPAYLLPLLTDPASSRAVRQMAITCLEELKHDLSKSRPAAELKAAMFSEKIRDGNIWLSGSYKGQRWDIGTAEAVEREWVSGGNFRVLQMDEEWVYLQRGDGAWRVSIHSIPISEVDPPH